jgi:hypothetical protein
MRAFDEFVERAADRAAAEGYASERLPIPNSPAETCLSL